MVPKFFTGAVVVALVAGGVWFFSAQKNTDVPADNSTTTQEPATNTAADTRANDENTEGAGAGETISKTIEVRMTFGGFSPQTFTIERGTTVRWINDDSRPHWPVSDVHPTHQIYPALDPNHPIAVGESWDFIFERAGEWHFHDHLNASMAGAITVLP